MHRFRLHLRLVESGTHGADESAALRIGAPGEGDLLRLGGGAGAKNRRQGLRSALLGVIGRLQHGEGRALRQERTLRSGARNQGTIVAQALGRLVLAAACDDRVLASCSYPIERQLEGAAAGQDGGATAQPQSDAQATGGHAHQRIDEEGGTARPWSALAKTL